MHVGIRRRGHLALLDRRHLSLGEENEDIRPVTPRESIDCRAACITGCRTDDRRPLAALGKDMVHQPGKQLHGDVLESQGRAMEKLKNEIIRPRLHQWCNGGMPEGGIGFVDHGPQLVGRDLLAREVAQDLERHLLVGLAAQGPDLPLRQDRPFARHIEAAIAREACEKRITEAENRCFSAGRNVFHYLQSPIDFCSRR